MPKLEDLATALNKHDIFCKIVPEKNHPREDKLCINWNETVHADGALQGSKATHALSIAKTNSDMGIKELFKNNFGVESFAYLDPFCRATVEAMSVDAKTVAVAIKNIIKTKGKLHDVYLNFD